MCGIVGYIGPKQAVPLLMDGLKRLEYRGYDSAGLASIVDGGIERRRAPGKLTNLEKVLAGSPLAGSVALGHTRWATHGKPSQENAHPHTDGTGTIAVIHNGIIENYLEIKDRLTAAGGKFESETDTEVIAHLVYEKLKALQPPGSAPKPDLNEPLLFEAVRRALAEVKGAYAIAVLWAKAPNVIIAAKTASPLIIGLGEGETFLASDIPAFLAHTRKAVFLEDGEMAVMKRDGVSFFSLAGKKLEKAPVTISWDRTMAEKGGFRHFMLKEINEQPMSCEDTMRGRLFPLKGVLERDCGMNADILKKVRSVQMIACGTAYHACLVGQYWFETLTGIPTRVETASEFRYRETTVGPDDLVIAISQSGETADTLAAVKLAKEKGAKILAICNTVGSALTRSADWTLYTHCGPELGVASTKAFIGQLTALAVLVLHAAMGRGAMNETQGRAFVEDLVKIPGLIRAALKLDKQVLAIARKFAKKEHFLFIGRYVNYPIALEAALKLKEISYIHAEGYAAGELKHGPIALIDTEMPVVVIATKSHVLDK
ncbi:MAG TPA: glutamine--fructose-6-phosphate transaminase (isomerizing), partial [Elusimicrobiota bacterium]|nr:glutamine--fructose-6-phosphate transaminase (isomerizing) [Elusimicrobiota bacterium]